MAKHMDEQSMDAKDASAATAAGNTVSTILAELMDTLAGAIGSRLLEEAPDGILVVDWEGRILLANRQVEALFGYAPKELDGRLVEILLPEAAQAVHRTHRAAYAVAPRRRPMGAGLELSGRRRDGSEFPVEISLSPLSITGRQLTIAIIRDVSDLRALQRERLGMEQAARAEAERHLQFLQTLIDTLPSGVFLVRGQDARLVLANRVTTQVWGTSWPVGQPLETFLATAGVQVRALNGEPLPLARVAALRALRDGETVCQHQEIIRQADGRSLPVLVNAVPLDPHLLYVAGSGGGPPHQDGRCMSKEPLLRDSGAAGGAVPRESVAADSPDLPGALADSAAPDLSDVPEPAALVVYQDVSVLYEAERLKDEFIAMVSHEVRNPVGVIVGYAHMLTQRTRTDPSVSERVVVNVSPWHAEALNALQQASESLVELTDDLLDITRLQAGRFELHREPHDLVALAHCVVRRMEAVATKRHVLTLELVDGRPIVVDIDAGRIEQVLTNLLTNAIKYSPDGGPVTVVVRTVLGDRTEGAAGVGKGAEVAQVAQVAQVTVRDAGIGIPADQQAYIFGRFARAVNAVQRQIEGTGLGLYLCRELVQLHGGRIWFESTEGAGTTFTFTLPLATDTE